MKALSLRTPLAAALISLGLPVLVCAQTEATKANLAVQITQARQANAALMRQYAWDQRTELLEDGTVKDTRLELVNYTPAGQIQRSLVSDQGPSLPRFGLRKRIAEEKQKEMQEYLSGLKTLLDQYTLPTAGKVLDFMNKATPSIDASGLALVAGQSVVQPGDSLSVWTDPATRKTRRIQVSTTYQGDPMTVNATFQTLSSGLTYMAFADVEVPSKSMSIQVSNFNFNRNS